MPSKSSALRGKGSRSWSQAETDILNSHLELYKNAGKMHGQAKKDCRKKVLLAVHKALKSLHPSMSKDVWEYTKTVRSSFTSATYPLMTRTSGSKIG